MHFLITGATGFLGQRTIKLLLAQGHMVTALSRRGHKLEALAKKFSIPYLDFDILNDSIKDFTIHKNFDVVVHLAWGSLNQYNHICHTQDYPQKHMLFLQHLASLGINNFVITGTSLEYGLVEGELEESTPCTPTTEYGKGKLELYNKFAKFCSAKQINLKWLRLFYMYADDQAEKTLWGQLHKAHNASLKTFPMSQGEQMRDYLHADTVADMIVQAATQNKVQGIINIGSGKGTQVIELVEKFMKENHSNFVLNRGFYPYPSYEPFAFWANTAKLNSFYNLATSSSNIK